MKLKILLTTFILMSALFVKGQILYTDFIPDTVLNLPLVNSDAHLKIDINQDGIYDFDFSVYSWYEQSTPMCCNSGCCKCTQEHLIPIDTNSKIGIVDTLSLNGVCQATAIDSGLGISNNSPYWVSSVCLIYDCLPIFLHCDQGSLKKFIGVKLFLNGNYYYGWIRFLRYTIYDMAINLTPNQPILASQFTIGINEIGETFSANIYPVPFNDYLKIEKSNNESAEIIIYDIASRKLMQEKFTSSTVLNTEQLAKGVYLYELRNKAGVNKKGKVVKD